MENPLFLIPVLTGPVVIFVMLFTLKFPPKKINSLYGYRTKRSMASQDAWDFAQPYSGKMMLKYMVIYTFTASLAVPKKDIYLTVCVLISLITMIVFMAIPIIKTEKELKERFGND
ncbi:MAG: SdpI family protein [Candidatus Kapaibacterium sp.]